MKRLFTGLILMVLSSHAAQAHLQTAHFKKYKEGTAQMVKSLKLIDTNPMISATLNKSAIR